MVLPFQIQKKSVKSDLNLRADLSIKSSDVTFLKFDALPVTQSGGRIVAINISGDYQVTSKVMARLFYDQTINTPFIQSSYPNANTKAGLSIRFTL